MSAVNPTQSSSSHGHSKYSQLLAVIEELGKDIRPTYTGNKMSAERLKRSIIHARILVHPNLLLCGLYQLDSTASDSRIGGIQVLAVVTESPQLTPHLKLLAQIDTPGVFDICELSSSFVCAMSDGHVSLFNLSTKDDKSEIFLAENLRVADTTAATSPIVTCVTAANDRIFAGDNVGRLHDIKLSECKMEMSKSWDGHSFFGNPAEVWTIKQSSIDEHFIFSGGDDSILKGWDLRIPATKPSVKVTEHSAGVTDVSECPFAPHLIVSGSYDNTVKLFDRRNWSASIQTLDVGGGAWQFVWHKGKMKVLLACMYNGWCLLNLTGSQLESEMKSATFGESLNYGVEWCDHGDDEYVVSSTFYDATVRLWRLE